MDPKEAMDYSTTGTPSEDGRLDAAWAKAERDFDARQNSTRPQLSPVSVDDVGEHNTPVAESRSEEPASPLMAHASDATLPTSNRAPLMLKNDEPTSSNCKGAARGLGSHQTEMMIPPSQQTIIQRYRTFLQKHEPSLGLLEHVMERFVFYGVLFKHDHRGINAELYYAAWNVVRWMNDVVLVGWGEGMGTTVGRREEWMSLGSSKRGELKEAMTSQLNGAVPILRAILTATTCIYPAMEAWSRRSPHPNLSYGAPLASHDDNLQSQEEHQLGTASDPSPQRRRLEWEGRQCRAAQVSYRLERMKFVSRLALLSISWWAQYQRHNLRGKQEDENEGTPALPSLLRRGGELDPYERLVPLSDAEDEAKIVQYVGRRTGRRSIARASPSRREASASPSLPVTSSFMEWLRKLASSKNRVLYAYAVGELLHILRPLYWSRAESRERRKRALSPKLSLTSFSFGIWKAWLISLLMDLISDKLLLMQSNGGSSSANGQCRRRNSLVARGGGRHNYQTSPSAEQAKLEELEWRRSRHAMYLLRSPMYNAVARPLATFLAKIVSMIPSFGLGQWAAEYALDLMSYWNDNHFMLES
ncbi:hypothetical protein ACHAXT_004943 [Thalassiosira profunda]